MESLDFNLYGGGDIAVRCPEKVAKPVGNTGDDLPPVIAAALAEGGEFRHFNAVLTRAGAQVIAVAITAWNDGEPEVHIRASA